jgi:hypothetical protein
MRPTKLRAALRNVFETSDLRSHVAVIERTLLPRISIERAPNGTQQIKTRAYIVLSHAAIEEFIEDSLFGAIMECNVDATNDVHYVSLCLTTAYARDLQGEHQQSGGGVLDAATIAQKIPNLYRAKTLNNNNGIRRKDFGKICRPLGFDIEELSNGHETEFAAFDTLAAKRGDSAHTFVYAAKELIHPVQAKEWVNGALDALDKITPVLINAFISR